MWLRNLFSKPAPVILMYHRVADVAVDPWNLCVSPRSFREHLSVLRKTRTVLPLSDFVAQLQARTLARDTVALTFDDGYLDNLTAAKPALEAAGVPATVFVTTGSIARPGEFWWDELAGILLSAPPDSLVAAMRVVGVDMPGASASDVHLAVWQRLRPMNERDRQERMAAIRATGRDTRPAGEKGRAMTEAELSELISQGLIDIGAHTVTHPALAGLTAADQREEIEASRRRCERITGKPVLGFAYPYGDVDSGVKKVARDCGLQFACTTEAAAVRNGCDLFSLPRLQVMDWDGDELARQLRAVTRRG